MCAKAYRVIATQCAKPNARLPHGYTANKCPSWSCSVCQWTANQAKESEARNVPEMGGAIRLRVPGGNVTWLWDGGKVTLQSGNTIDFSSWQDIATDICWQYSHVLTSHPGFALRLRVRVHIRRSDSLAEHIDFCSDKCHKCSENVRCPTVISSSEGVIQKWLGHAALILHCFHSSSCFKFMLILMLLMLDNLC